VTCLKQTLEVQKLRFEVKDSGIGIAKDKQLNMFEKFSQAESSTSREFGGTGLGLSICKLLVELMHGEIGVESVLGGGGVFWFEINLGICKRLGLKQKHGFTIPTSWASKKNLIAENNRINQKVIGGILKKWNISFDFAVDGSQALKAMERANYDLVFMDMQMPVMNGVEATVIIRENKAWSTLPVLAMTANAMLGFKEQCIEAGMNDFLTKPLTRRDVQEALIKWL
jgi:CheY-like chemotaxis protein